MKSIRLLPLLPKPQLLKKHYATNIHSEISENISKKKLEHYRNLNALQESNLSPIDWDEAKPFESVPGPKPLPIIGNTWRFLLPKIGDFYDLDFLGVFKTLHHRHGDIAILKNVLSNPAMVILYNPKDIEKLHRNEGVWPTRIGLPSFEYYRELRKNVVKLKGLVNLQGEEWFQFRSAVNPILMQPRNVTLYTDKMNSVAQKLVENIQFFSEKNEHGQMADDFINELYKWSLESIGLITMDKRLETLNLSNDTNSEPQKLIRSVIRMFQLMYKLDVLPSLWKTVSTPAWREYVKVLDFILETNLKHINEYVHKIKNNEIPDDENKDRNVLYQMLKIDKDIALAMSLDMMIAGVDTTGRVLGASLYYLSQNPDKQQKLREESFNLLKNKDSPVTNDTLSKIPYTKAVIKETTRLSPIAVGNMRTLSKNVVLSGYQIPKGTNVISATLLLSNQEKHFPRAKEFLPERWLSTTVGELSHKNTNPFVFAPFGFGARSCIGKRLAHLELETAILKIVRNFELKWPHEDMVFTTTTLHGMAKPLKIHVTPLHN